MKSFDGRHREGCNNDDDGLTRPRQLSHHFTFDGSVLCPAATSVVTLYHYLLGWSAPYGDTSLPKLLGIAGGMSLIIGITGLFRLNLRRDREQGDAAQILMDRGFIALPFLTAASGLLFMSTKHTAALPMALCGHLGSLMALFASLPHGKLAHGVHRSAALPKWSIERRQASRLQLAED